MDSHNLLALYEQFLGHYGQQGWWPAETAFEVMVGAVLTQNTAWTNVESAITNLKRQGSLSAEWVNSLPAESLAQLIRPSGYYNVKARRLQNLCQFLLDQRGEEGLAQWPTERLRHGLLGVNGIGEETADDILLYAFSRPVFVIDAYTRRIFSRLGGVKGDESYGDLSQWFSSNLPSDVLLYNEYHALIVKHAKQACSPRPQCDDCVVRKICRKLIK